MSGRDRTTEAAARQNRIDVDIPATLITADGDVLDVRVRDISGAGFRLTLGQGDELLVGEQVVLKDPQGDRSRGEIRWSAGREAGGVFLDRAMPA